MNKEVYFCECDGLIRAITMHDYSPAKIDENAHDVIVQILHIIINLADSDIGGDYI